MKKRLLYFLLLLVSSSSVFAQKQITGVVIDGNNNEPFPFANVYVKDASIGSTTDIDGRYEINIPNDIENPVLVFQFMGYSIKEIVVGDQTTINVTLKQDSKQLDEVVVTSFGIKRERKALNYAIQDVKSEDIVRSKETNVINSLRGKVAGVQITSSSGSPGASSQILIRGSSSVSAGSDNQPLYIVDGVIVSNASDATGGNRGMDIDPDDVESMTILKGPAAAALYGWAAANGAIVITTKSGKSGKLRVDFGTDLGISTPMGVPRVQNKYMQGTNGYYSEETSSSWGPLLPENYSKFDNVGDFFGTGVLQKYNASVSGGTEKLKILGSFNVIDQTGIVPTERYSKYGGLFKVDYDLSENLKIGISSNFINTDNDRVGYGFMSSAYRWPINKDMKRFEDENGDKIWLIEGGADKNYLENPYWWTKYNSINSNTWRNISNFKLNWTFLKDFNLNYTLGYDQTRTLYNSIVSENSAGGSLSRKGYMRQDTLNRQILNSNMILAYSTKLTSKINIGAMIGNSVEMVDAHSEYWTGEGQLATAGNIDEYETKRRRTSTAKVRNVGLFGYVKLDYDDTYFIEFTGRNDWVSTLSPGMNSFFYPSVTFGAIVSEYFGDDFSRTFSFLKLRANYAGVGKATAPERTRNKTEDYLGIGGGYNYHYLGGNWYIKPEFTKSYEFGFESKFFNGKTHLDFTYYNMLNQDQIVTGRVSPTSGFVMMTFNAGSIRNSGYEIFLNQTVVESDDFKYYLGFNFSKNNSVLEGLPDYMDKMIVTSGQVLSVARPSSAQGYPVTGIDGTVYLKNKEGQMVVDEYGYPRTGRYVYDENGDYTVDENGNYVVDYKTSYIGNREPDFMVGITNTIEYKGFDFSFLFDIRKGGDVINATAASMNSSGMGYNVGDHRNSVRVIDGVVEQEGGFVQNTEEVVADQTFFSRYTSAGENYVEDGSWVRLRNVRLGYTFALKEATFVKNISLALTANNLWMWTKYSGGDPETNFGGAGVGGAGTQGLDYYNTPSVRTFSFNLKASF